MSLSNRRSVMAIMKESTEGTPVFPSAATDYIAIQDGFSMEPGIQTLENKELRSSLGKAKPILGIEQPKASFDHYIRHSGVEGTAPNYSNLLEAAFGTKTVAGTAYNTTSGSSASTIHMASGAGAHFQRGQAMLIKDGTNGYSIRPVLSVATDNITLGFNVANAPATGISTGKAVMFSPADSGHPSLTISNYRANGGATEVISGGRVTDFSIDFNAGDLIAGKFSVEGVAYYFDPVTITSSTKYLDFLDEAVARAAVVTVKTYKDPADFASALETSMNSLGSSNTFTVSYSSVNGKYTIASNGTIFQLLFNTGTNTANTIATKIGFSAAADQTSAVTYTSSTAISFAAPQTPTYDSADPLVAKDNEVIIGDAGAGVVLQPSKVSVKFSPKRTELKDVTAASGVSGSLITEREAKISFTSYLNQFDADKFKRFRANDNTQFLYNFGVKSGGNWVAGKCGCVFVPSATISSFKLNDDNGLVTLECELTAYVDSSGNGEIYLNFI
jgi:hypothetical protein